MFKLIWLPETAAEIKCCLLYKRNFTNNFSLECCYQHSFWSLSAHREMCKYAKGVCHHSVTQKLPQKAFITLLKSIMLQSRLHSKDSSDCERTTETFSSFFTEKRKKKFRWDIKATTDLNLSCVFGIELQRFITLSISPPGFQHSLQFLVVTG